MTDNQFYVILRLLLIGIFLCLGVIAFGLGSLHSKVHKCQQQQNTTPVAEDGPKVIEGSGTVIHGERLVL